MKILILAAVVALTGCAGTSGSKKQTVVFEQIPANRLYYPSKVDRVYTPSGESAYIIRGK